MWFNISIFKCLFVWRYLYFIFAVLIFIWYFSFFLSSLIWNAATFLWIWTHPLLPHWSPTMLGTMLTGRSCSSIHSWMHLGMGILKRKANVWGGCEIMQKESVELIVHKTVDYIKFLLVGLFGHTCGWSTWCSFCRSHPLFRAFRVPGWSQSKVTYGRYVLLRNKRIHFPKSYDDVAPESVATWDSVHWVQLQYIFY